MQITVKAFFCLSILAGFCACKNSTPSTRQFIETGYMDSSVKPGDNFYRFVNGKWLDTVVIPPTETNMGSAHELYNSTKNHIKSILDSVSSTSQTKGSIEQKVGDFYGSGMDTMTIEKRGYDPVKPYLQQINNLTDANSVMQFEAQRHKEGFNYIAGMGVLPDDKNSNMNIAVFYQTGIGLPDRDYYFKTDEASVAIQNAYKKYMLQIFTMTGSDSATAAKKVTAVYDLEKQLAENHRTRVQLRDPQSNYNKYAVSELDKQMPNFGWSSFF